MANGCRGRRKIERSLNIIKIQAKNLRVKRSHTKRENVSKRIRNDQRKCKEARWKCKRADADAG